MSYRLIRTGLTIITLIVLICVGLSIVHKWQFLFSKMIMLCCLPYFIGLHQSAALTLSYVLPSLSIAILLLGGISFLWRLWRTYQYGVVLRQGVVPTIPSRIETIRRNSRHWDNEVVVLHDPTPFACCFGLLHPRMYLSTGLLTLLSDDELKAVILHEAYHCRRFDPLRTLILDVIATMFCFLPVVHEWCKWQRTHIELQADRYAIQQGGRKPLAGALYKLLTKSRESLAGRKTAAVGFSATEMRLNHLLTDSPVRWHLSPLPLLRSLFALLLICIAA